MSNKYIIHRQDMVKDHCKSNIDAAIGAGVKSVPSGLSCRVDSGIDWLSRGTAKEGMKESKADWLAFLANGR